MSVSSCFLFHGLLLPLPPTYRCKSKYQNISLTFLFIIFPPVSATTTTPRPVMFVRASLASLAHWLITVVSSGFRSLHICLAVQLRVLPLNVVGHLVAVVVSTVGPIQGNRKKANRLPSTQSVFRKLKEWLQTQSIFIQNKLSRHRKVQSSNSMTLQ